MYNRESVDQTEGAQSRVLKDSLQWIVIDNRLIKRNKLDVHLQRWVLIWELYNWINSNIQALCLVPTHSHTIELFLLISHIVVLNLKTMFHPAIQHFYDQTNPNHLCSAIKNGGFIFIALMILSKTDWIYSLTKGNAYRHSLLAHKIKMIYFAYIQNWAIQARKCQAFGNGTQQQHHRCPFLSISISCLFMRFDIVIWNIIVKH